MVFQVFEDLSIGLPRHVERSAVSRGRASACSEDQRGRPAAGPSLDAANLVVLRTPLKYLGKQLRGLFLGKGKLRLPDLDDVASCCTLPGRESWVGPAGHDEVKVRWRTIHQESQGFDDC